MKSTLEMKYVIQDLERQKLEFPVICGGAALTRKYVEDDLRREYSNAVFYADDAFAGLHIMEDLATANGKKQARLKEGRTVKEYAKAAAVDEETGPVFAERSPVVSDAPNIPTPPFWGVKVRKDFDLRELFPYINETALFKNQWQLKTASQEDYLRLVEQKFRPIKKQLEDEIIATGVFEPKVVYGYFPAQGEGNDVIVYDPDSTQSRELLRFTFPRQREGRKLSISDFFAPKSSGKMDVIGLSLVTMGAKASVETQKLFEGGEYTKYLYLHGLSVETAEALAESAQEDAGRTGHRRRRLAPHPRSFPPEVSRLAIFIRLPGVPESGRPDQALRPAPSRGEYRRALDRRIPAGAGAVHLRDCRTPSRREIFRSVGQRYVDLSRGTSREAAEECSPRRKPWGGQMRNEPNSSGERNLERLRESSVNGCISQPCSSVRGSEMTHRRSGSGAAAGFTFMSPRPDSAQGCRTARLGSDPCTARHRSQARGKGIRCLICGGFCGEIRIQSIPCSVSC